MKSVGEAVPLGIVVVTGALNYWFFGPKTMKDAFARREVLGMSFSTLFRTELERYWTDRSDIEEMSENKTPKTEEKGKKAKKAFARTHAMCIHLNAISLVATVWYAFSLTSGLLDL